jgi:hypothetical protein
VGSADSQAETPQQMLHRAQSLRACAGRARSIAAGLGPYLDSVAGKASASPPIWQGPYAQSTTAMLNQRKSTLHQMATDLLQDAGRWESEATRLEGEANQAANSSGGSGR